MKRIILSAIVLSAALVSCKKDDKTCDLNATNIVGSYKTTAITYKADASTPAVDIFNNPLFYAACEKDDIIVFNANNTLTFTDAGTACTPPNNDTGTWSLSGSVLNFDGELATVTSFTCSGMTATIAGTTAGELTTITLAKQ
jgi:hypothetical protein